MRYFKNIQQDSDHYNHIFPVEESSIVKVYNMNGSQIKDETTGEFITFDEEEGYVTENGMNIIFLYSGNRFRYGKTYEFYYDGVPFSPKESCDQIELFVYHNGRNYVHEILTNSTFHCDYVEVTDELGENFDEELTTLYSANENKGFVYLLMKHEEHGYFLMYVSNYSSDRNFYQPITEIEYEEYFKDCDDFSEAVNNFGFCTY